MKIGFYDSGLGGIKTLKDIINMGLKEEIYFLADEKNKPYGTKNKEKVKQIAIDNVNKLVNLGCKIIVVACNTATSVAIEDLREKFTNIEIIGTEPAIKLAIDEGLNKKILVMATTITVNGEKLKKLIKNLHADEKIELLPADKLVTLVEDKNFLNNQDEINQYLNYLFKPYNLDEFSHIILGCTHFPIVKQNIQNILNEKNKNLKVIDGNEGIGKNLFKKLESRKNKEKKLSIKIITTADNEAFKIRVKEILGDTKYEIERNDSK